MARDKDETKRQRTEAFQLGLRLRAEILLENKAVPKTKVERERLERIAEAPNPEEDEEFLAAFEAA